MNYLPCRKRKFKMLLAGAFAGSYKRYIHFLKHLLQRLGYEPTLILWEKSFNNYNDKLLRKILSTGWTKFKEDKTEDIVKEISKSFEEQFKTPIEGMSAREARQIIEKTPPISQTREHFDSLYVARNTTTYEALHIVVDALAILIESLLQIFGKEGELIAYDFLRADRASVAQGKPTSFKQFVSEKIALIQPAKPNIFTAGLDIEIVQVSDTEIVFHIKKCEWARYFQERHPQIGYLIACSTDEAFARACNAKIRMQRTSTLMEGGKICDFRYYIVKQ